MALAFARLAAIAAATLVFFVYLGVVGGIMAAAASGLGQTFSSCLRARESSPARITRPLSCQRFSKTQKQIRALSLTPTLASAKALFIAFSNISRPPEASMACFDRAPCTSR